mmetsp:Transcript_849/g.1600  ORF Transcript_849/g.1600 Transcript_849/m.1600 type:complete len:396 (-) Transcript_849:3173-4360(-)
MKGGSGRSSVKRGGTQADKVVTYSFPRPSRSVPVLQRGWSGAKSAIERVMTGPIPGAGYVRALARAGTVEEGNEGDVGGLLVTGRRAKSGSGHARPRTAVPSTSKRLPMLAALEGDLEGGAASQRHNLQPSKRRARPQTAPASRKEEQGTPTIAPRVSFATPGHPSSTVRAEQGWLSAEEELQVEGRQPLPVTSTEGRASGREEVAGEEMGDGHSGETEIDGPFRIVRGYGEVVTSAGEHSKGSGSGGRRDSSDSAESGNVVNALLRSMAERRRGRAGEGQGSLHTASSPSRVGEARQSSFRSHSASTPSVIGRGAAGRAAGVKMKKAALVLDYSIRSFVTSPSLSSKEKLWRARDEALGCGWPAAKVDALLTKALQPHAGEDVLGRGIEGFQLR